MDMLPGQSVSGSVFSPTLVQRERWPGGYGRKGTPLVSAGQEVLPDQPVLRLQPVRPGEGLRLGGASAGGGAEKSVLVPAGLRGRVSALTERGGVMIESHALRLPGVLGVGRQVAGVLALWQEGLTPTQQVIPPGAILVVPGSLSFPLLRQAAISGIVGLVASSMALRDLEGFLRADLVKLLTSDDAELELAQAYLPPLTLLLTAGLGERPMAAQFVALLSRYLGSIALLNGRTLLRSGRFPELLISLPPAEVAPDQAISRDQNTELLPGALVRIYAGKYAGTLGLIDYLFVYGQKFSSGVRERAARVQCEDGSSCVVPLSLIERIR